MTTIIYSGGTIEPIAVSDYATSREGGNIVHPILGRAEPDVTLRPANLRTGTLTMTFADEGASRIAEDAHATGAVFGILSDERPTVEMSYVVAGAISRTLGAAAVWTLTVDFQEVSAS